MQSDWGKGGVMLAKFMNNFAGAFSPLHRRSCSGVPGFKISLLQYVISGLDRGPNSLRACNEHGDWLRSRG